MFPDLIGYIWKHAYRFSQLSLCEDAYEPFSNQNCHRVEPVGNWWVSPSYFFFPPFQQKSLPNMGHPIQHLLSISVPMLSYSHRPERSISPIMTWSLRPHTSLPYSFDHFPIGSLFCVSLHKHVLKYLHEHLCLLLRCLLLMLHICLCSHFLLKFPINHRFCFSCPMYVITI